MTKAESQKLMIIQLEKELSEANETISSFAMHAEDLADQLHVWESGVKIPFDPTSLLDQMKLEVIAEHFNGLSLFELENIFNNANEMKRIDLKGIDSLHEDICNVFNWHSLYDEFGEEISYYDIEQLAHDMIEAIKESKHAILTQ